MPKTEPGADLLTLNQKSANLNENLGLEDLMPNGYTFSYPKVRQFQDENDKTMFECCVNVMDFKGQVVAECGVVDVDEVDAKRRAVDQADAFMRGDRGTLRRRHSFIL
jgi:hypothetical protein